MNGNVSELPSLLASRQTLAEALYIRATKRGDAAWREERSSQLTARSAQDVPVLLLAEGIRLADLAVKRIQLLACNSHDMERVELVLEHYARVAANTSCVAEMLYKGEFRVPIRQVVERVDVAVPYRSSTRTLLIGSANAGGLGHITAVVETGDYSVISPSHPLKVEELIVGFSVDDRPSTWEKQLHLALETFSMNARTRSTVYGSSSPLKELFFSEQPTGYGEVDSIFLNIFLAFKGNVWGRVFESYLRKATTQQSQQSDTTPTLNEFTSVIDSAVRGLKAHIDDVVDGFMTSDESSKERDKIIMERNYQIMKKLEWITDILVEKGLDVQQPDVSLSHTPSDRNCSVRCSRGEDYSRSQTESRNTKSNRTLSQNRCVGRKHARSSSRSNSREDNWSSSRSRSRSRSARQNKSRKPDRSPSEEPQNNSTQQETTAFQSNHIPSQPANPTEPAISNHATTQIARYAVELQAYNALFLGQTVQMNQPTSPQNEEPLSHTSERISEASTYP